MPQFKTLQFPNTSSGQAAKVRALEEETANGWRVVSETIVAGKFKTEKACCFFLIFAPCAFLAGHESDTITITLEKPDTNPSAHVKVPLTTPSPYDKAKWNALRQYDSEISAAADEAQVLGPKWEEELAAAYMAISDKAYLRPIMEKLKARASAEAEAEAKRQEEERLKALAMAKASEILPLTENMISTVPEEKTSFFERRWYIFLLILAVALIALALISTEEQKTSTSPPPQNASDSPTPTVARATPSFDCSKVTADTLKLICSTPELADADMRLANAYKDALARSTSKTKLRHDERAWIVERNNDPADVQSLSRAYEKRISELEN